VLTARHPLPCSLCSDLVAMQQENENLKVQIREQLRGGGGGGAGGQA